MHRSEEDYGKSREPYYRHTLKYPEENPGEKIGEINLETTNKVF